MTLNIQTNIFCKLSLYDSFKPSYCGKTWKLVALQYNVWAQYPMIDEILNCKD